MTTQFNPVDYPILYERPLWLAPSAWARHIPFGMLLVQLTKPACLVELGTYYGTSYCGFCQAVAALQYETRCHAVDTWQGDEHTGPLVEQAFAKLKAHHDPLYAAFSTLHRCTFDAALDTFADGTVDLLHIDGFHTYEAAARDYQTWRPKLSERGIVMFHDTNVFTHGFGVHKLWAELAGNYPSLEFKHGFGLGVLAVGTRPPDALLAILNAPEAEKEAICKLFEFFGNTIHSEYLAIELEELKQSRTYTTALQLTTTLNKYLRFLKR